MLYSNCEAKSNLKKECIHRNETKWQTYFIDLFNNST